MSNNKKNNGFSLRSLIPHGVLLAVIGALLMITYNGVTGDIEKNYEKTCELEDTKAEKETLKIMLEQQNIMIKQQTEYFKIISDGVKNKNVTIPVLTVQPPVNPGG